MANVAYIDHSFHKKTLSTSFIPDLLRRHGHVVDFFWDDSWSGGGAVSWSDVEKYDVVIMFQAYSPILQSYYRELHPNVIFIPMLDQFGIWQGPLFNLTTFWQPFQGSKIISFSGAVHAMAVGAGVASYHCRYYQDVANVDHLAPNGLHGFFWLRREDQIPWKTIKVLISETKFDSLHIHLASDPGSPSPELPTDEDLKRFNITTSTWFQEKSDFTKVLERANVFFCPRMEEGIGQSFLEALSRGQCVVAPNNGTMNEYILSGVNGLLFDSKNPRPLCFDDVKILGAAAKKSVVNGRLEWKNQEELLVKYILTASEFLYLGKYTHPMSKRTLFGRVKRLLRFLIMHNSIFKKLYEFIKISKMKQ